MLLLGSALLVLGALVQVSGGGLRAAGDPDTACAPLSGMAPVAVAVRGADGSLHTAAGYASGEGALLVPVRGLVERAAPVYWDETGRTVSLLGPQDVLSVHFRGDRVETRLAVLNGEAVATHAVLCAGQVYLPADLVSAVLDLEVVRP